MHDIKKTFPNLIRRRANIATLKFKKNSTFIFTANYSQNYSPAFTDDASVMETWGKDVSCLNGDPNNIKVTIQKDLFLAEYLLQTQR